MIDNKNKEVSFNIIQFFKIKDQEELQNLLKQVKIDQELERKTKQAQFEKRLEFRAVLQDQMAIKNRQHQRLYEEFVREKKAIDDTIRQVYEERLA